MSAAGSTHESLDRGDKSRKPRAIQIHSQIQLLGERECRRNFIANFIEAETS